MQDTGRCLSRQIEIGGDVESGAALEDDLLDSEIAAVEGAYDARVQRRALGPRAQVTPHAVAEVLLARGQIGHGGDARDCTLAFVKQSAGFVLEVRGQSAMHVAEDGGIGEEIPIVRGLCKGSGRGKKDRDERQGFHCCSGLSSIGYTGLRSFQSKRSFCAGRLCAAAYWLRTVRSCSTQSPKGRSNSRYTR